MDFSISDRGKEVVRASSPLEEQWLPLSNLDFLLPPLDFSVFFCYRKPQVAHEADGTTHDHQWMIIIRNLKRSLAQTLVLFYPLSGELVKSSTGEPAVLCNNGGVEFFEAYADVELRNLDLHKPDASVEGKLVPRKKKDAMLSVLVTELKCGALIVACTFDHRTTDAYSANMFLVAWAEMTQSKVSISLLPSFNRSLLSPRRPLGSYHSSLDDMYIPVSKLPPPPTTDATSRIYYITAEKIYTLQAKCKRTKLESLSAYLWKAVARNHLTLFTKEYHQYGAADKCKMGIVVDGRTRLRQDDGGMTNYFGNVLSIPFGEETTAELSERPLSWVANAVHEFLTSATSEEHFLGLVDWVEAHRPESGMTRIYNIEKGDRGPAFVVSSGQSFPVSRVDFGWGRPVFGSYHFPWGGKCGYVMPMPSASREGDWTVYVHLLRRQLELLEKEAGDVLQPITPEYILLLDDDDL